MKPAVAVMVVAVAIVLIGASRGQPDPSAASGMTVVNSSENAWRHDAGDPAGSESIAIREDEKTGAVELFARYPAGHVFPPHWHTANERIILLEGRMSIADGQGGKFLEPGGFAYLPAKETQRMACVSTTRCSFYVYWDGKLDFHKAD